MGFFDPDLDSFGSFKHAREFTRTLTAQSGRFFRADPFAINPRRADAPWREALRADSGWKCRSGAQ